jgi:diguanylate cyclase (GGDEF)-like protein
MSKTDQKNNKNLVPYAQQQLSHAIDQLKLGIQREQVLPLLETVLSQLQSLNSHDHLTGVFNRRTVLERLDIELQRSMRTGHTFSFAVISVDGLPEVMEAHGQEVTKQVLQVVAQQAGLVLRNLDSFGRIAATEFAIVMPTTWLDQSMKAINRLKLKIQHYPWDALAQGLTVTFSTGLTSNAPKDTTELMLDRALQALELAKTKGQDQIVQLEAELPSYDQHAE